MAVPYADVPGAASGGRAGRSMSVGRWQELVRLPCASAAICQNVAGGAH